MKAGSLDLAGVEMPGFAGRAIPGSGAPPDLLSPSAMGLASGNKEVRGEELRRAAREFEGIFLRMLLGVMIPEDGGGLFGGGPAAGVVRGLFVDQVGAGLAERRALGIADLVERSMERDLDSTGLLPEAAGGPAGGRPRSAGTPVPVDLKA